ncbi:L-lactate dehydrogenase 1 [Christensenellaceae bacterium]|nr:L-lactate dehydrogenase 1 [Christensenellaceae bacterium]BDF60780.1 L-lactate dehydrogenase 1 [Christensenellaceae bacterium]
MSRKVTIIGAGSVGSTITYTMAVTGLASEVVMIDINTEKALGEAMDVRQGTPFCSPMKIYAGTYEDAKGSDVVIITSGMPRKAGQSRIDLAQTNVDVIKQIAPDIVKHAPDALYILVSNPVDILTYTFCKVSGLPESRIIGSGTILDTARLRSRIAEYLEISQKNIHAYVMGEHGDSSFVPWSIAQVGSVNFLDYKRRFHYKKLWNPEIDPDEIENYIRTSGAKIIGRKGATFYAIAISVCTIVQCMFGSANTAMTVSSMLHGEYGIDDVCLSIPFLVGPDGVCGNVLPPLTEEEVAKLRHSADVLKNVIKQINL